MLATADLGTFPECAAFLIGLREDDAKDPSRDARCWNCASFIGVGGGASDAFGSTELGCASTEMAGVALTVLACESSVKGCTAPVLAKSD